MPSLRSRAFALLVRLSGRRRRWASADIPPGAVVAARATRAAPPARMRRRFRLVETWHEGRDVVTVAPRSGPAAGTVLYLHGGGYVSPVSRWHWRFIARMVEATGLAVVVPDYPLVPEHDCSAMSRFALSLYRDLLARHGPSELAVMGDSAGGGLGLSLLMQAASAGLPAPAAGILLSPWLDVTMTDPSQEEIEPTDVLLMRPAARTYGRWYAGPLPVTDPRVSPLFGTLSGLPPILMLCGAHDILVADARRLAARAAREGRDLTYHEEPGQMHVYALFGFPEARRAQARIAGFLRGTMVR